MAATTCGALPARSTGLQASELLEGLSGYWFEHGDEVVFVEPALFLLDAAGAQGTLESSFWVFEPEATSTTRKQVIRALRRLLPANLDAESQRRFARRTALFFVDNERNKRVTLDFAATSISVGSTGANGRLRVSLPLPQSDIPANTEPSGRSLPFTAGRIPGALRVHALTQPRCLVVSDFDDTLRHSFVLDEQRLLASTFWETWQPTPGSAAWLAAQKARGCVVAVLSAGPEALAPEIWRFLSEQGALPHRLILRPFRLWDGSAAAFLEGSRTFKAEQLAALLSRFPEARVWLVGDSGEGDPEIYGEAARRAPDRIAGIAIRHVEGARNGDDRFAAAFRGVAAGVAIRYDDAIPREFGVRPPTP
jgi:phosphatidate phosphatase APP1